MKIIKQLSVEIADNIDEAREKIKTAYALKIDAPEAAAWYREMASAHINFNNNGHNAVKKLIDSYKNTDEYKRSPAFADGMITAWEAVHSDLIAKTAEVKAMIDGFK